VQSIANMVQQLGAAAVEFKIFCSNKDLDGSLLTNVEFDKWINYNANTRVWYSSKNNLLPLIKKEIKKEAPDLLFTIGIYSWPFNFKPLLFCRSVKKIISVRGMLHTGGLSQKGFKKKIYLQFWKVLGLHKRNIFHATDEEEKKYIQQVFGVKARVVVAANFPRVVQLQPVIEKKTGHLKLVSIALISPMKNILLVLEALQLAVGSRQSSPDGYRDGNSNIEYNIYGPVKEGKYWQECLAQIKKMPPNITVNYHGDIAPDKIEQALAKSHVFILPSKSENFGHAIYEALTAGRPVITSKATPWNNLQSAKAGINVSTDDTQELINAIDYFAGMNQEQLNEWSNAAREYALNAVDIYKIRKQYEVMFGC